MSWALLLQCQAVLLHVLEAVGGLSEQALMEAPEVLVARVAQLEPAHFPLPQSGQPLLADRGPSEEDDGRREEGEEEYTRGSDRPKEVPLRDLEDRAAVGTVEDLSLSDLLNAIEGSRSDMVAKIDSVAIEVNLLRTNIRKVVERVTTTEGHVENLQPEVAGVRDTVSSLQKLTFRLEEHIEDAKGRSQRNNLCFMAFPENAKGQSAELFLEEWIATATALRPHELSKFFTVERAHRALVPLTHAMRHHRSTVLFSSSRCNFTVCTDEGITHL
ncbi:hypothetical protein NDU88_001070 [Pleurodeles waltl]|uniref:Uncharacterized protein n=1 Tax=Pleurodeles waltl TaxID=8319 RepID=A0AAV7P6W2_PLEWA|nr:hypothetical protein NDU88_001070 [Pleurodeles waltl]